MAFDIRKQENVIALAGRLDASNSDRLRETLDGVESSCTLDLQDLDYIASAGLGVLLGAQKRLSRSGYALRLINLTHHVGEIFRIAGFDQVFEIE